MSILCIFIAPLIGYLMLIKIKKIEAISMMLYTYAMIILFTNLLCLILVGIVVDAHFILNFSNATVRFTVCYLFAEMFISMIVATLYLKLSKLITIQIEMREVKKNETEN